MQLDPSLPRPSSSSLQARLEPRPGVKRTYSQQATQPQPVGTSHTAPPPAKMPRRGDNSSSFAERRQGGSMNPPSTKYNHRNAEAGPSSSHLPRQGPPRFSRGKKKQPPGNTFSAPYHSAKYIEEEHAKCPIPLTHIQKSAPRSYLNNLYTKISRGTLPEYVSVHGTIQEGSRSLEVWRQVNNPLF